MLVSISGDNKVNSFKMNGQVIEGKSFVMPNGNVVITEIILTDKYAITLDGNYDVSLSHTEATPRTKVVISSLYSDMAVSSFIMNGQYINGNSFIMPNYDVIITNVQLY